jgi:hypothetical protein
VSVDVCLDGSGSSASGGMGRHLLACPGPMVHGDCQWLDASAVLVSQRRKHALHLSVAYSQPSCCFNCFQTNSHADSLLSQITEAGKPSSSLKDAPGILPEAMQILKELYR